MSSSVCVVEGARWGFSTGPPRDRSALCSGRWDRSAPPPPPGAQPPPLWGSEQHLRKLFGDRVDFGSLKRDVLEVTAFERARDFGEHFKARYGPTIAARANAQRAGRAAALDAALDEFCEEWNCGTAEQARFEMEYLLAVGARI